MLDVFWTFMTLTLQYSIIIKVTPVFLHASFKRKLKLSYLTISRNVWPILNENENDEKLFSNNRHWAVLAIDAQKNRSGDICDWPAPIQTSYFIGPYNLHYLLFSGIGALLCHHPYWRSALYLTVSFWEVWMKKKKSFTDKVL